VKKKNFLDSTLTSLTSQIVDEKEKLRALITSNDELTSKITVSKTNLESAEKEVSNLTNGTLKLLPQIKELEAQRETLNLSRFVICLSVLK
jgi:chromosome segregation ATPase